jgi:hypothetical protein
LFRVFTFVFIFTVYYLSSQDVDKSLKPKYKAKDFHKISSENKTGTKKSMKGKKNEKRERLSTGESEKERKEKKSKQ